MSEWLMWGQEPVSSIWVNEARDQAFSVNSLVSNAIYNFYNYFQEEEGVPF